MALKSSEGNKKQSEKKSEVGAKRPHIRINSSKISRISDAQFSEPAVESKFSQWRAQRESNSAVGKKTGEGFQSRAAAVGSRKTGKASSFLASKKFKRWGYSVLTLLLLGLIFIGLVFYSPLLATKTITVQGTSILSQSGVEEKLSSLEGTPLTRISENQVKELIGTSNVLRDVSVEARPPHELVVTVQERVPVAAIQKGDSYMLVDAEGVQLSGIASLEDAGVPLVDGGEEILGSAEYRTLASVLEALPASLLGQVKEAKADSASTISLKMTDGVEVVWGTAEDNELKAKVLTTLMQSLGEEKGITTYDVSSPKVPTVK